MSTPNGNKKAKMTTSDVSSSSTTTTDSAIMAADGVVVVVAPPSEHNHHHNNNNNAITVGDFDRVRQYLLSCPYLNADNVAIRAALIGLDQEEKRIQRDMKLKKKFASSSQQQQQSCNSNSNNIADQQQQKQQRGEQLDSYAVVTVEKPTTARSLSPTRPPPVAVDTTEVTMAMADDWHDVSNEEHDHASKTTSSVPATSSSSSMDNAGESFLGRQLAKEAIAALAQFRVKVKTPLAAIAVVLHAAMRSSVLNFACTGMVDDEKGGSSSSGGGFAAPIREIPKTMLLPRDWDNKAAADKDKICLRYRKNGTGSMILRVTLQPKTSMPGSARSGSSGDDAMIEVTFYPTSRPEPPSISLTFALVDHLNLDSWTKATASCDRVEPALHYKALATLMSSFAKTFDLGNVRDNDDDDDAGGADRSIPTTMPFPVDTTMIPPNVPGMTTRPTTTPAAFERPVVPPAMEEPWRNGGGPIPTVVHPTLPGQYHRPPPVGGDFADDLLPAGGGIVGPPGIGGGGLIGNLMGPNHPMFQGNVRGGGRVPPPDGMLPPGVRYDPPGPRNGPMETDDYNWRNGFPGGRGGPNDDQLRMPGGRGSNNSMFM